MSFRTWIFYTLENILSNPVYVALYAVLLILSLSVSVLTFFDSNTNNDVFSTIQFFPRPALNYEHFEDRENEDVIVDDVEEY